MRWLGWWASSLQFHYTAGMESYRHLLFLVLLGYVLGCCALSQAEPGLPHGLPPALPAIVQFKPDLDVYPQNFAVATDASSRVYIGTAEGVLVFDGEYWQQVPLPNGDIVRWLEYDGSDRVYVGGYDAFGYLEAGPDGRFVYYELSGLYNNDLKGRLFADIWRIAVTEDAVYFVALAHLFRYEPATGHTRFWDHPRSLGPITVFQGQAHLQFRGEGIKRYVDGQWQPVLGPDLSVSFLNALVSVDDHTMLIISADDHWYRYDGNTFSVIPDSMSVPLRSSMTHGIALDKQTLVLATQRGKLVFYDLKTGAADVVPVSDGFLPAVVAAASGSVIVVDELGFYALHWPARWRIVPSSSGLTGTVYRLAASNDRIYAMTSSGAFVSDAAGFKRLDWTDYEAWDMLTLSDGSVLFADSYEIKLIDPDGSIEILDKSTTARVFKASTFNPGVVYVGTEFGLQVLRRGNLGWQTILRNDDMDNMRVTQIIEAGPQTLWVGSERGGIRRLDLGPGLTSMKDTMMTAEDGIDYDSSEEGAYLYEANGGMVAVTSNGMFQFRDGTFKPFDFDGLAQLRTPGRGLSLATVGADEPMWAYEFNRLFRHDGDQWHEEPVAGLRNGAISTVEIIGSQVLAGNLGAILVFEDVAAGKVIHEPAIALNSVQLQRGALDDALNDVLNDSPGDEIRHAGLDHIVLEPEDTRVTIRYALPDFRHPEEVRYRTRLYPVEAGFSPWTEDSQQSFIRLDPGKYELKVQARSSDGRVSELSVPVTVQPKWYESTANRLIGFALGLAAAYALMVYLVRRRSLLLRDERDRLEFKVAERTRELESANQQLDRMAHLDGLTQIPNRRRLDTYMEDVRTQCMERGRIMAVSLIDVDHFKRYNDTHGHPAGDALLVDLARLFSRNLRRAEDLVARYGGEEFLVILPGADVETAHRVIEGMRARVAASDLGVTVSAGLHVTRPDEGIQSEQIIEAADAALYRAKEGGRNQVVIG